jgi:hypothetical protein
MLFIGGSIHGGKVAVKLKARAEEGKVRNGAQTGRPLYLFAHIPKTGGGSVRMHFRRNIAGDHGVIHVNRPGDLDTFFDSMSDEARAGCQLIQGHGVKAEIPRFFPGRKPYFFTIMREPIALMISTYNWQAARGIIDRDGEPLSFDEWLKPQGRNNFMSRWLLTKFMGQPKEELRRKEPERLLDEVRAVLKNFWVVAKLEDLERTLSPVCKALGIPESLAQSKNVAGRDYGKRIERTPEVEDKLRDRVAIDKIIYEEFAGRSIKADEKKTKSSSKKSQSRKKRA